MDYKSIQFADKPVYNSYVSCHGVSVFQSTFFSCDDSITSTSQTGRSANAIISTAVRRIFETETRENYDAMTFFNIPFKYEPEVSRDFHV
jgi:hypothetical protein